MNLCIDIGNSRCKYALFDQRKMVAKTSTVNPGIRKIRRWHKVYGIHNAIISTTRNLDKNWFTKISADFPVSILTHKTRIPINNKYETPATLGKDRLAGVIAAHRLHPGKTCLVADLGTCNTFDVIDQEGNYLGGNISPGWKMRIKAMHRFTDRLPEVDQLINSTMLGTSTVKALQNGAFYGAKGEIESFIRCVEEEFGEVAVIFTGGDALEFAKHIESKIFVHPYLVMEGLNEILLNE